MTDQGEMNEYMDLKLETNLTTWHYPIFTGIRKDAAEEKITEYNNAFTTGTEQELIMEGIYVWYGKFLINTEKTFLVKTLGAHVQMRFNLSSTTTYLSEFQPKTFVRFKPQQHNLLLLPDRDMMVQWHADQESEVFCINLSTDFFFNFLPEEHPLYEHFQSGIRHILPAFLSNQNLPLTPKIIAALFEILNCPYAGYHKSLFVKAKVIELLALQFDQYEQLPTPDITSAIKKDDIEKMHLAREILIENLESPLSLKDLAHRVGTNEYNLKKYFKEIFGTTVFGYLHDVRMQQSREELTVQGSKIADIAQRIGYKHATHFTAAFKKHFGFLPTKFRVGLLNLLHFSEYFAEAFSELLEKGSFAELI